MPIITPAYPSMCATHNVTKSTLSIITRELHQADAICSAISEGKRQWKDLFQRHTFFSEGYKYYLSIVSASTTKDAQLIWSGLVQSKVRRLVAGIEQSQPNVNIAHPYTKGFDRVHKVNNEDEKDEVLQGSIKFQTAEVKTTEEANNIKQLTAAQGDSDGLKMPTDREEQEAKDGPSSVFTTTFYVGIELKPGSYFQSTSIAKWLIFADAKSLDISWPVAEFKRQCTEWQQYNEELNSIRIVHVKRYAQTSSLSLFDAVSPTDSSIVMTSLKTSSNLARSDLQRPKRLKQRIRRLLMARTRSVAIRRRNWTYV